MATGRTKRKEGAMSEHDSENEPAEQPLVTMIAAHASYCLTETLEGDGTTRIEGCETIEITVIDAKRRIGEARVKVDLPDVP